MARVGQAFPLLPTESVYRSAMRTQRFLHDVRLSRSRIVKSVTDPATPSDRTDRDVVGRAMSAVEFDASELGFDASKFRFDASKFSFDASYVKFWIGCSDVSATESALTVAPEGIGFVRPR